MPVKWTPELDSIILHSVFEEYNVTISKPLCAKIAERLKAAGTDCTPKAIEGRLYGWKKKNSSAATPTKSTTTTAAAPKTPRTPSSRTKMGPKKKLSTPDSDDFPDNKFAPASPSTGRGKRARKSSNTESDGEEEESQEKPVGKRVKVEPMDKEGFSFVGGGEDGEGEEV